MDLPCSKDDASDENTAHLFAMQLATLCALPMTLKAAIELDVFEIIAKEGPGAYLSPADIVAHLPTQNTEAPAMLDRMLCLLASYSILICSVDVVEGGGGRVERRYGLAPVSKYLVKNADGVSVAPVALLSNHDKVLMESWYHLKDAVLEGGIPFNKAYGMTAFEYLGTDTRLNKMFNRGMSNHTTLVMNKILEVYNGFAELGSLTDVGGGLGVTTNLIVTKYPHIKAINFDLKHVIDDAPAYPGVEHVHGDFFTSVPRGDAIFMKWILHDWNDEHCVNILKNCYKALPDSGKVIIAEMILPMTPIPTTDARRVFQVDMVMLAYIPGGKERTQREYESLAKAAGFSEIKAVCCAYNTWVMEIYK